jgi:hypothetical protein
MRGEEIAPVNLSYAHGSCTDCETLTVALQLNLYQNDASTVAPQNAAVAINDGCTGCYTVARALQVSLPLDDPREVPHSADRLIREMDRELRDIHRDADRITVEIAEQRIAAVIAEFIDLANEIWDSRDEAISGAGAGQTPRPVASPAPDAGTATPTAPATAPATPATVEPVVTSIGATPQATSSIQEPAAVPGEPTATAAPVATSTPQPVPAPPTATAESAPMLTPPSPTPPPTATGVAVPTATASAPPSPVPPSPAPPSPAPAG